MLAAWFWTTVALYGAATAFFLGFLLGAPAWSARAGRLALYGAVLANFLEIGARGVEGIHPASSAREIVGFIALLMAGGFVIVQIRRRLDVVGAFVAPAAIVLLCAARLTPDAGRPGAALGALGRVHISLAAVGVSIFAVATALAILYLLEERQLKRRKISQVVKKGAALETLDKLAHRCVQVGFPIFTLAMVTGALWSARLSTELRPEYAIAMVAWAAFAALLVARLTAGWRGKRAAVLTVLGFSSSLVVLAVYLVRAAVGA